MTRWPRINSAITGGNRLKLVHGRKLIRASIDIVYAHGDNVESAIDALESQLEILSIGPKIKPKKQWNARALKAI